MGFFTGVWRLLGAEDDELENGNTVEFPQSEAVKAEVRQAATEKIIAMPEPVTNTLNVLKPTVNSEGKLKFRHKAYAAHLRKRQVVLINISELAAASEDEAKRLLDYLTGVAEAVDGDVRKVAEHLIVFVPDTIKLIGDPLESIKTE